MFQGTWVCAVKCTIDCAPIHRYGFRIYVKTCLWKRPKFMHLMGGYNSFIPVYDPWDIKNVWHTMGKYIMTYGT